MRIRTAYLIILFHLLPLCVFPQSEQLIINLSPQTGKRNLSFENPKGSVKVTGYDGEVILVTGTLRYPENQDLPDGGDLRKITKNGPEITAEAEGNNIIIYCRTPGKTVDFDIKVPRDFSLNLKSLDNGIIEVLNVRGEMEINNTNGDISLINVSGSAVVNTVYGKIKADFREVSPASPMMFTSFEGDINIELPPSVNALLKMQSGKGEITSDFNIIPVKRQPVIQNRDKTKVYSLEDWITGSLNNGGPEYIIRSYNGNIIVRKNIQSGNLNR